MKHGKDSNHNKRNKVQENMKLVPSANVDAMERESVSTVVVVLTALFARIRIRPVERSASLALKCDSNIFRPRGDGSRDNNLSSLLFSLSSLWHLFGDYTLTARRTERARRGREAAGSKRRLFRRTDTGHGANFVAAHHIPPFLKL